MAQQLNLFDPRFAPRTLRFSAQQGLLAVAGALLLTLLASGGLRWASDQAAAAGRQAEADQAPLRAKLAALGAGASTSIGAGSELLQLRAMDAGQRRIRGALEGGAAGVREGHADYLLALARQASGTVWITGFSVSDDGNAIELDGRMTDTAQFTDYLRRLNAEPRFKGRPFAQLNLRATDASGAALPYTEFSLRSSAVINNGKAP
jgi:Tfp pilus assembly protein PilN